MFAFYTCYHIFEPAWEAAKIFHRFVREDQEIAHDTATSSKSLDVFIDEFLIVENDFMDEFMSYWDQSTASRDSLQHFRLHWLWRRRVLASRVV